MKRALSTSENSLIPAFCSSGEEQEGVYGSDRFHPLVEGMEEDDGGEEEMCAAGVAGGGGAKKRRLSVEQVRALEKNFEVENKLEPERKVRLAKELGLQPRQVAVWFQNRRARWKTKQLERDYAALKATYDALRLDFDSLHRDKESLLSQIKELKEKLAPNESSSFSSAVKEEEEPVASETAAKAATVGSKDSASASDSDSSAIVNDAAAIADFDSGPQFSPAPAAVVSGGGGGCSSSVTLNPEPRTRFFYQNHEMLKMEEEDEFLSEPCGSFFADEQEAAATLSWYYSDHWNLGN